MSDENRKKQPKTQPSLRGGGPPRPPKKTAKDLEDDSPDDFLAKMSAADRAAVKKFLESFSKHQP